MLGLAVISEPYVDEDLLGFLYRLADLNALTGAELLNAFRAAPASDVASWIDGTGRSVAWANVSTELRCPYTRSTKIWNCRSRKFCPHCLGELGYWRESWSLMLVTCCVRHHSPLQDCCSACGCMLTAEAMRCLRCTNCDRLLAKNGVGLSAALPGALWIARQLTHRISRQQGSIKHVTAHLTLSSLHELALRIGIRGIPSNRKKPLKLRDAGVLAIAGPIAESAGRVLMAWPSGFYCLLDAIRAQRAHASRWRIGHAMGPIYHDIFRHLCESHFDFVRRAFESYVHDRWEAPLALRNRNLAPQLVRQHRWVPVQDAARAIGVDPALLRRMAERQEIPVRELARDSGRVARVVDLKAVRDHASQLRRATTLEQAAVQLGLGEKRVRQLLAAGMLAALGGPPRARERWWIDPVSIEQCARHGYRAVNGTGNLVSVAHLARFCVSDARDFVTLIQAIHSGKLSVLVPPHTKHQIGMWLLDEAEVAAWRSPPPHDRTQRFSVNDAAIQLGVKQEVAYSLVRAGILAVVIDAASRRTAQWITAQALREFRKRYVLGTELAAAWQTSPKQVVHQLMTSGIQPVAGPGVASALCRQYVWLRSRKTMALATAEKPCRRRKS